MHNPRLDSLPPSPFVEGLPALLAGVAPPAGLSVIDMGLGAPTHEPPEFVKRVVRENEHLYGKYPSTIGSKRLRDSIAAYLARRYALPAGAIEADRH
jgi:aspartate/methionine/tyrosine aminotransferase